MDFECIETWLELPEFRVTGQVMRPHDLELHLERRDTSLVCPRCQGSCARIKEGRQRCIRDLPILDRPVTLRLPLGRLKCSDCHHRPWEQSETFGERVKWTERLYHQVRQECLHGCPCHELASRYGLSARRVFRWTFEKSQGGRPRKLGRALGIDEYARRAIATIRSSWTWTKVDQSPRLKAGGLRTWWHGSKAARKPNLME